MKRTGRAAPWSRSRGLPPAVHQAWSDSLRAIGRPVRVLAWAEAAVGHVIGGPADLSVGDGGSWTHLGWHQIERGEWNAESRTLSWVLVSPPAVAAPRGSVELTAPARVPELFRERVAASIAVREFVPIRGDRGITVTARRDLAAAGSVSWHATLTRGLTWGTDGVRDAADAAIERLRAEYGLS